MQKGLIGSMGVGWYVNMIAKYWLRTSPIQHRSEAWYLLSWEGFHCWELHSSRAVPVETTLPLQNRGLLSTWLSHMCKINNNTIFILKLLQSKIILSLYFSAIFSKPIFLLIIESVDENISSLKRNINLSEIISPLNWMIFPSEQSEHMLCIEWAVIIPRQSHKCQIFCSGSKK